MSYTFPSDDRLFCLGRTTEAISLFTYRIGTSHSTFQVSSFEPKLSYPTNKSDPTMVALCGNSMNCMYDYVNAGPEIAQTTVNAIKESEQIFKDIESKYRTVMFIYQYLRHSSPIAL